MSKHTMRKYDKEFKTNAVNLYAEGKHSISKLSEELGIPESTLAGWIKSHQRNGVKAFPGKGNARAGEEVRQLRKEVNHLRRQRDILKYGSRRIHKELRAKGHCCSRKRIARLMRASG